MLHGFAGLAGATTLISPQGRLTLQSATPVMTADQVAKGTIFYDSFIGNQVPVWPGSGAMVPLTIVNDEMSLILDSTNHLSGHLYDIFAYSVGGVLTLGAGPSWLNTATITVTIATPAVVTWTAHGLPEGAPVIFTTTGALPTGITAGTVYFVGTGPAANTFNISTTAANASAGTFIATSGSQSGVHTGSNGTTVRGTGAGTTELQLKNGIWTNKNAITLFNNSASSGSIAANLATFLGTFYATANGQTGVAFMPTAAAGGAANVVGLCNAYNTKAMRATSRDSTASWTTTSATWALLDPGATGAGLNNRISYVDCLGLSVPVTNLKQSCGGSASTTANVGVLRDATAGSPALPATHNAPGISTLNNNVWWPPSAGFHYLQQMQQSGSAGVTATYYGTGLIAAGGQSQSFDAVLEI